MIIHGNEIMEPEELTQLGAVFDEAWAAVSAPAGEESAEQRPPWPVSCYGWPISGSWALIK